MTSSHADAWEAALRLLAVRDRSVRELRERLQRKGFAADAVEAVLDRALAAGYLDDTRFARQQAEQLSRSGRMVGPRLLQELRHKGLPEGVADAAVREAEQTHNPEDVLRDLLARRFAGFDFQRASRQEQARVVRFFQRRGFPLGLVLAILNEER